MADLVVVLAACEGRMRAGELLACGLLLAGGSREKVNSLESVSSLDVSPLSSLHADAARFALVGLSLVWSELGAPNRYQCQKPRGTRNTTGSAPAQVAYRIRRALGRLAFKTKCEKRERVRGGGTYFQRASACKLHISVFYK